MKNHFNFLVSLGESDSSRLVRKAIVFPLITWLPLFIISMIEGNAINSTLKISFLTDYSAYVKFLVSMPLIFIAGIFINYMITNSMQQFMLAHIIPEDEIKSFEEKCSRYLELKNSWVIGVVIFLIGAVKIFSSVEILAAFGEGNTWEYLVSNGREWTIAGYWVLLVCLPIYQYLVFRLFWRFIIWGWFLWKVSRMNLKLVASDPDMSAGLAFLGPAQLSFGMLGFAQSCSLSSEIANKAIYFGVSVDEFRITSLISVLLLVLIYLFPLFFFTRKLLMVKLKGNWEFGVLTHKYTSMFESKWIHGNNPDNEQILGTGDIQSLADIGSSSEVVNNMRIVPMSIRIPVAMLIMIAAPFVPLIALKYPASEILKSLIGFIF